MRSLRSGRKAEITNNSTKSNENTELKMCNKRSKPGKTESRKARPVLADRTNSDLDSNSISSVGIIASRPKRTQNIPAKYRDHELSPIKNYKPESCSTPLAQKNKIKSINSTPTKVKARSRNVNAIENKASSKIDSKMTCKTTTPVISVDTVKKPRPRKTVTPIYKRGISKAHNVLNKDSNVEKVLTPAHKKIVLLEKPKIQTPDRMALYEFDFDPNEEPNRPKKKRVRKKANNITKKKTAKSDNANDDADLQLLIEKLKRIQEKQKCKKLLEKKKSVQSANARLNVVPTITVQSVGANDNHETTSRNDQQGIACLSPIPSISRPPSPLENISDKFNTSYMNKTIPHSNLSAGSPVASSSMIVRSTHKASPWRVGEDIGVRKWPLNFHVKASMTPSYDRDTVHVIGLSSRREDNSAMEKAKHVYTNISINASHSDELLQAERKETNWKQTSILSFYEESLKRSAKKRSLSPKKCMNSYNFEGLVPETNELCDSINESQRLSEKSSEKEKATVDNCFGFDDSMEIDQENISPAKISKLQNINTVRGTSKKTRKLGGPLKEMGNERNLPMRVLPADILNIIEKQKFMEDIDEPRSGTFTEKLSELNYGNDESDNSDVEINIPETSPSEGTQYETAELFAEPNEPELVHFSKPSRRSYETRRKPHLTFQLPETTKDINDESDYDSDDTSIIIEKAKKAARKKKKPSAKTKKEEKAVDEWAAGFNSMLEEVEDFPLCVE